MAYSDRLVRITYEADASVAVVVGVPGMPGSVEPNIGTQYRFVKMITTKKDTVGLATGAGGEIIAGVTTTKAQQVGTGVAVAVAGRVPIQSGAALAIGTYVIPDSAGKAVAGTATTGVGIVVEPSSAADALATIELLLKR